MGHEWLSMEGRLYKMERIKTIPRNVSCTWVMSDLRWREGCGRGTE